MKHSASLQAAGRQRVSGVLCLPCTRGTCPCYLCLRVAVSPTPAAERAGPAAAVETREGCTNIDVAWAAAVALIVIV